MNKSNFLFALIIIGLLSCGENDHPNEALRSLVHGDTINHKFLIADSARNSGLYTEARLLYLDLEKKAGLTKTELHYTRLNTLLCELLSLAGSSKEIQFDTLSPYDGEIPYSIIKGLEEINRGKSGALPLQDAKQKLLQTRTINTFEYFLTLELLGINYRMIEGKMDSALFYFKEALQYTKVYPILSSHASRVLLEIADVCIINRDEITGMTYATEAFQNSSDPYFLCKSLIVKGTLFRKLEAYDSAKMDYKRAQEFITEYNLNALEPFLLSEQILTTIILQEDSLLHSLIKKAQILNSHGGEINLDRLLGYNFYEKREYQKSIYHYERALNTIRSSRVPDLVLVMEAFYALTEQYIKVGKFDKAEEYAYKSLVYTSSLRDTPYTWSGVLNPEVENGVYNFVNYDLLAEILLLKPAYKKSDITTIKKALTLYKLIDSLMLKQVRVIEEEAVINFLAVGHKVYSGGIEACYKLYQKTQDTVYLSQAHHFMERGKGLMMYRDILVHSKIYFPDVQDDFREKELQMKAAISNLRKGASLQSAEMRGAIGKLEDYYNEMSQKYPEYYKAKYELKTPTYYHFQNLSARNKLSIVQYHASNQYLYSLTYDQPAKFTRIELDSILREGIFNLKELLYKHPTLENDDRSMKRFMKSSAELYSKLIEPLHLVNHAILIVPDGDLSGIPFEILTSDSLNNFKAANYLIKNYTLNYAHSLNTYELAPTAKKRAIKNILTYSYEKSDNNQISLPGTEKEAKVITEIFKTGSTTSRQNKEATKANILNDLQGPYDLIHLGLHSSSSTSDRLSNKIHCSGNGTSDVFGFEIAPLTVQAHTIVLSSCQSAYGSLVQGEGTYSLARAFKQTGVTTVVSSLWDLTDQSTVDIMTNFYRSLNHGRSASESLALAKRQYLSTSDEITAHPYFWAAMICHGD